MKQVLIIDDEPAFILSLKTGLEELYSADFNVVLAENGREALKTLESNAIDLVVTDLRMPEMDGFELLAYMSSNYPSVPAIVMSAYGTPEIRDRLKTIGTLKFIEKPTNFQELAEAIIEGLQQISEGGSLRGISLASFLQLIEMEQKTCLLEVSPETGNKRGIFYFNSGVLFDAVYGSLVGEEAALKMLSWDAVDMNFRNLPKKKIRKRIKSEVMALIMEALRIKDEAADNREDDPSDTSDQSGKYPENKKTQEVAMNVQKLNEAIEIQKQNLGNALLATDIYSSADGQSLVGYNSNPKACALFNQVTGFLSGSLKESEFPPIGKYYILDLEDAKMVIVIPLGDFQWGMLVDSQQAQLGLLLNVVIPKIVGVFEEAVIS